ncbi:hypothetical protein E2C01_065845 [Portunus trituberculatus]|uniref:Uncharacterized protein n=1 Tax=Portunus trituberculatus TaxID=210409 RepID=A0A5B7HNP1_PORTR|nr:hypothetical protein [Portunus trituberculatus]
MAERTYRSGSASAVVALRECVSAGLRLMSRYSKQVNIASRYEPILVACWGHALRIGCGTTTSKAHKS